METAGNLLPSSAGSRQGDRQERRGDQEQPPRTDGIWRSNASISRHLLSKQHGALVFNVSLGLRSVSKHV